MSERDVRKPKSKDVIGGSTAVDEEFLAAAQHALRVEGCTALEFLRRNPGVSKIELAKRLDRGTSALGLVMAIYKEAAEEGVVREIAMDLLIRQVAKEFPHGWACGGSIRPGVKLGSWQYEITKYVPDSEIAQSATRIIKWLTIEHLPPDGWKPLPLNDPLLDELFTRFWREKKGGKEKEKEMRTP